MCGGEYVHVRAGTSTSVCGYVHGEARKGSQIPRSWKHKQLCVAQTGCWESNTG